MRSIASAYAWPDFAAAARTLADVSPEKLARLTGTYLIDDGSIYIMRSSFCSSGGPEYRPGAR
jgi:hypothetical protein